MPTLRVVLAASVLLACSKPALNTAPSAMVTSSLKHTSYDGNTDDLLTAGLGMSGLQGAAPTANNPSAPLASELRRLAIYNNYRALVDITTLGGYGVLYGPNIDTSGNNTLGQGKIAGDEYLAYFDDGSGSLNVTMMVQIPTSFDPKNPCIVTATSSGSRGVYGAIATAGEWGLKHGCAVAYTDKGTGNGAYDVQNDTADDINGLRDTSANLGKNAEFVASLSATDRAAFNTATPNRFAYKHAHSQKNPEKDWGKNTLDAIDFAFYLLNEQFGKLDSSGKHQITFWPGQVIVIAASVSNGGGASLAAAEQDTKGLISGVVAGEPQVQMSPSALTGVTIKRGANAVAAFGKPLFEYFTIANLYQPCAALSTSVNMINTTLVTATATARCNSLKAQGLLTASGTSALADEALGKLHAAGWETDSDVLHSTHYTTGFAVPAVTLTYANAYGRFSVKDSVCGYSLGTASGTGAPAAATTAQTTALLNLFGTGNGVPPTGPVSVIQNNSSGGAIRFDLGTSATSGTQDYDADGAVCLRNLFTGTDAKATAVKAGIAEVQRSGNLHGKPAILVQGRADTLVPINHASRAYYAADQFAEGAGSKVRFYEVANAQHFDAFLPIAGYAARLVPLHRYVINSLDLMYAYLKNGTPLPPSQVVRTTPRGNATTQISATNVPPIAASPAASDTISFSAGTLTVPE